MAAILEKQAKIQKKQLEVVKSLAPGQTVPYMAANGGFYKPKLPQPPPDAPCAPALPDKIHVYCKSWNMLPLWRRYVPETDLRLCHAVLVEDVANEWYSEMALLARLHGLRLVSKSWALTKMREGDCMAFAPAVFFHLYIYLSDAFCASKPSASKVLLTAAKMPKARLVVAQGSAPEKPKHPRLTFEVNEEASEGSTSSNAPPRLDYVGLLEKLTVLRR